MFEQADDRKETLTVESSVVHVEARASDRFAHTYIHVHTYIKT